MALTVTQGYPISGVSTFTYDNLDTADTDPNSLLITGSGPVAGSIQAVGSFGGGTVALQGSNDGTNWFNLEDVNGTAIGLTADGITEFSTSALHIRPLITGGTSDDVDVVICVRG